MAAVMSLDLHLQPPRCAPLVLGLLVRPHPLDDLLANGRIALRHHHDGGIFLHRKALVGDRLHQLLVGLVDEPLLVGLAGGRFNLLRIVLFHVGNLVSAAAVASSFWSGMFCDGSDGDGAGDCTCAFATGTAVARIAAVKNCAQSRIVFSPILRANLTPRPPISVFEAPLETSNISQEGSGRNERSDMSRRMSELDGAIDGTPCSIRTCIGAPAGIWLSGYSSWRDSRGSCCACCHLLPRLIVVARALSQELRDDELIVSLDHCSRWEAPRGATKEGLGPQGNRTHPTEGSVRCN